MSIELEKHAKVLIENQEFRLARNIYRQLLKDSPKPGRVLLDLAKTFMLEGQWAKARKLFDEAMSFEVSVEAVRQSALASSKLFEFTEAVDRIERALSIKDLDTESRFELLKVGSTYALDAQWMERAEQWSKEALRYKPSNEDLYIQLGTIGARTQRAAMAKKAYELALVVNPKSDRAWSGLGGLAIRDKQTQVAYDCFVKALHIEVNNPPALFYLVQCAYALKRYAEAEQLVQTYCDRAPVNPNLLYSLAGLQFHQGKFQSSMKTIDQVLGLRPEHAGALELKTLCERYFTKETRTWKSLSSSTEL